MTTVTRRTTAFRPEGYLTLADLRRIVAETYELDDTAEVFAGLDDQTVDQIDTIIVSDTLAAPVTSEEN